MRNETVKVVIAKVGLPVIYAKNGVLTKQLLDKKTKAALQGALVGYFEAERSERHTNWKIGKRLKDQGW